MLQNLVKNSKNVIFIDGSYFCFHRYYSMINWWKMTYPLDDEVLKNPYENEIFRNKFISTFINSVDELVNKIQLNKKDPFCIIVGKDCKRENIWRTNLFPEYKSGRNRDGFMGKPFFKMVYEEELFQKGGANLIISFDNLEADDCIAISTKFIKNVYPNLMV